MSETITSTKVKIISLECFPLGKKKTHFNILFQVKLQLLVSGAHITAKSLSVPQTKIP